MPGPYFVSDKCQEDKCLDPLLVRTNARRTNARTHRSRHLSIEAFVPSRHLSFEAFVLLVDKCLYRHLSYQAFVFRGICLLTDRPDRPDRPDRYSHPIEYERGGARIVKHAKLPIS